MTSPEPVGRVRPPKSPWLQLCPPGTVELDIRSGPVEAPHLSAGLPVVLMDQRPFSRRRLRRVARDLGIMLEREFVVLPTIDRPMVIIDDVQAAIRHFWTTMATVPPGLVLTALPASALLSLARRAPWRWTGAIVPGRVAIGRRP